MRNTIWSRCCRRKARRTGARYLVEANRAPGAKLARALSRWRPIVERSGRTDHARCGGLAALASARLAARPWSPSALEQFAACPYKFALNGIHGCGPARMRRRWKSWIR